MEKGKKFGAILDGYFDKDYLIEILEEFNIPKAGKKEELVKRILKNTTIIEYAIKELLRDSYKEQLVVISEDLGIDSSGNASELKQEILDELEKDTDDKSLQNKITFLDACFDKDWIIEIMEEFDRPKAGKKLKLVEVIAKNQSMLEYAIKMGVRDAYKEDIEDLCDKLGIDSDGSKKDLESRIQDYLFKKEKTSSSHIEPSVKSERKSTVSKSNDGISEEDLKNDFENFDPYEMEELVSKLFKAKGYEVETTKKSGDFGIDVWANSAIERIAIQVKHQANDVGYDAVAKTIGSAMTSTKIILVSTKAGFTKQVYEYQIGHPQFIVLWNSEKLKKEIRSYLL